VSATLVVAALKVLRGEIRERGIMTAEAAFEPRPFFDEMVAVLSASSERSGDSESCEGLQGGKVVDKSFEWLA
jgi:hypothetical protein